VIAMKASLFAGRKGKYRFCAITLPAGLMADAARAGLDKIGFVTELTPAD